MEDYTSNSKKSKEKKEVQETIDKHIEKVVSGEVIQKNGLGHKFKETFFGGDAKRAVEYVAVDVMLPALRNLVVDAVSRGMEKLVYGDKVRPGRGPTQQYNYGSRYQYGNSPLMRATEIVAGRSLPPDPRTVRGPQNRQQTVDIIIPDKNEADLVLERLYDVVEKYDVVSLADLHELCGIEVSHVDYKWGWTSMAGGSIRQTRQGYLLDLPPLEAI